MELDRSSQLCGECHVRGNPAAIDASNGFEKHHEQYEDLYNSKHFAISCVTCHDLHASVLYDDPTVNPAKGIVQECQACHWLQDEFQNNRKHLGVDCIDCHMPPMGKSAQGNLEIFTGDVRSLHAWVRCVECHVGRAQAYGPQPPEAHLQPAFSRVISDHAETGRRFSLCARSNRHGCHPARIFLFWSKCFHP